MVVAYRTACLCDKLNTALMRALNIVAEWEESVAAQSHLGVLSYPLLLLFHGQHLWLLLEEHLPCAFCQYVLMVLRDIYVDGVVAVGTANLVNKRKVHHLWMLAQPPDVGLVACQTSTVDAALLTSTDADGLSILNVANRV